uniref:Uncharacterized protein n=1 Tax=Arundo donax TaxID=35708 RepID=A0A0A9D6T5_ARUDO
MTCIRGSCMVFWTQSTVIRARKVQNLLLCQHLLATLYLLAMQSLKDMVDTNTPSIWRILRENQTNSHQKFKRPMMLHAQEPVNWLRKQQKVLHNLI